nr:hypothetical protein Q903MT_gene82 [Picea sitchensis]
MLYRAFPKGFDGVYEGFTLPLTIPIPSRTRKYPEGVRFKSFRGFRFLFESNPGIPKVGRFRCSRVALRKGGLLYADGLRVVSIASRLRLTIHFRGL